MAGSAAGRNYWRFEGAAGTCGRRSQSRDACQIVPERAIFWTAAGWLFTLLLLSPSRRFWHNGGVASDSRCRSCFRTNAPWVRIGPRQINYRLLIWFVTEIYVRIWLDEAPENNTYFVGFAILGFGSATTLWASLTYVSTVLRFYMFFLSILTKLLDSITSKLFRGRLLICTQG